MDKLYIKITLIPILCFIFNGILYADNIYTWVDENGVTHFSDKASGNTNATAISDTPESIIQNTPRKTSQKSQQQESTSDSNQKKESKSSQSKEKITLTITEPTTNTTFQNMRAQSIPVQLSGYEQVYKQSGYISLMVDGMLNRTFTSGDQFSINMTVRGEHTLQAVAYSSSGFKLAESEIITFYIHNQPVRRQAGATRINNENYRDETTKNYDKFYQEHNKELIDPANYGGGFTPTAGDYRRQVTGE